MGSRSGHLLIILHYHRIFILLSVFFVMVTKYLKEQYIIVPTFRRLTKAQASHDIKETAGLYLVEIVSMDVAY
jgi:hypothetical protein